MKYIFPVLLLAAAFTSCKKDYTCECTNPITEEKQESTLQARREDDARYTCEATGNRPSATVGYYECKLK